MSDVPLRTVRLTRRYGGRPALAGADLEVGPGRVMALLGPNGAGKTTLMRLAAGLIEPTGGRAEVFGRDARRLDAATARRRVALIEGHEPPGWARLADLEALQAGASPRFDHARWESLVAERGLDAGRSFGGLSKGQRRWVLGALALASGAELLLLDEPADGLDPAARRSLYDHLRDHATDHDAAVLVATHVITDVERVADDVAILDAGRVRLAAALEDLRETVREVELAPGGAAPEGTELLASRIEGGRTVACVRGAPAALPTVSATPVRPVNLETLYLALTGAGSEAPDAESEEATR